MVAAMNNLVFQPHTKHTGENTSSNASEFVWVNSECLTSPIVILGDESSALKVISKELKDAGFTQVDGFTDSDEAMEHVGDADLVLMDLQTPEVGISLLKAIRAQKETRFLPVIVLAAAADFGTRMEALAAGANDFLNKPADASELVQRVNNVLCFKKYADSLQVHSGDDLETKVGSPTLSESHLTSVPSLEDCQQETDPRNCKVLVIDDEAAVSKMIQLQLKRADYKDIQIENDATAAIKTITDQQPDLVILDIHMPEINGLEILEQVKADEATAAIPVLIMTGTSDERIKMASLKLGASDFITKPANPADLDARVFNSLKLKLQHDQLVQFSQKLTQEIEVRTAELFSTRRETILCLGRAAEARDLETGNHVVRVGHYAAIVARKMGTDEDFVDWIELAAQLHDVGKLSIPDAILCKPGKLTPEERTVIETHCDLADRIFFGASPALETTTITSPVLQMGSRIASTHHEKWDGTGYPNGLKENEIPLEGRITAVADVFDALSSKRCYKDAFPIDKCFQIIEDDAGTHFDPDVVQAFLDSRDEILEAKEKYADKLPSDET